jgi:hypothetical protein
VSRPPAFFVVLRDDERDRDARKFALIEHD